MKRKTREKIQEAREAIISLGLGTGLCGDAGNVKTQVHDKCVEILKLVSAEPDEPTVSKSVEELVVSNLTGLYYCDKVWSAWGYGTMTEDNFFRACEHEGIVSNLCFEIQSFLDAQLAKRDKRVEEECSRSAPQHNVSIPAYKLASKVIAICGDVFSGSVLKHYTIDEARAEISKLIQLLLDSNNLERDSRVNI